MKTLTTTDEMQNVAVNLRVAMESRKWNQVDLSRASGVPQYTISRILRRTCKPSLAAVSLLAKALCVKIDLLLASPPRGKTRPTT